MKTQSALDILREILKIINLEDKSTAENIMAFLPMIFWTILRSCHKLNKIF
jgi:hypothetical protein